VRKGLVEGGGAKLVDSEFGDATEHGAVLKSVLDALSVLRPTPSGQPLDPMDEADSKVEAKLCEVLGARFGKMVASDGIWAKEVLGITSNKT